jgi:hypothetical protein
MTPKQLELMLKHGTPDSFADAVNNLCPYLISMTEAETAIEDYLKDWEAAGMSTEFTKYKSKDVIEARPYVQGECIERIYVPDEFGVPVEGGMLIKMHFSLVYMPKEVFDQQFELA